MNRKWMALLLAAMLCLAGCAGQKEAAEVLTFDAEDLSGVNSIDILNCRSGSVTQIIYPDQIAEIVSFLETVRGVNPESAAKVTEESYTLTLKDDFDTVMTLTFGETECLYTEAEPVRYTLEGVTHREVLEFFASYHNHPFSPAV